VNSKFLVERFPVFIEISAGMSDRTTFKKIHKETLSCGDYTDSSAEKSASNSKAKFAVNQRYINLKFPVPSSELDFLFCFVHYHIEDTLFF